MWVWFINWGVECGCGLLIGAWHVGVVIMVPETIKFSKKLRPMIVSCLIPHTICECLHM